MSIGSSKIGTLEVQLKHATDLKNVEMLGLSGNKQDPYCVIKCETQHAKSATHSDGGRNPVWNQGFSFMKISDASTLRIEIFDANMMLRDVHIGTCKIPLKKVAQVGEEDIDAPVITKKGKHKGQLLLCLRFVVDEAASADATKAAQAAPRSLSQQKQTVPGNWILPNYGGKDVKEDYNFGGKLGSGTFGITYAVFNKKTGEAAACKTISKRKICTAEEREDIRREVQVMFHLAGHPNIVHLSNVYEDTQNVHLIVELCSGGELFDRIVARGAYTERDAATIMRTILNVVAYCARMGVMHRDLKPENFLLASKADSAPLKVTDFGLSVFYKDSSIFTDLVGSAYYVAPEVLKRSYSFEADVWSCGVIAYILLCGLPPFYGDNERQIFNSVLNDHVDFRSAPWPRISDSAKDCIRHMLERDVKKRWTAAQVLEHEWIRENGSAPDTPIELEVVNRLKKFSAMNQLKQRALQVIAANLPLDEITGMKEMFKAMDKDNSGTITVEELKQGLLRQGSKLPDTEIKALMENADVNNDGTIDYNEFLAATISASKLRLEENLKVAFQSFDLDQNGKLTMDELQKALDGLGIRDVEDIIKEADVNGDGNIDYNEFCSMMREYN